MNVIACPNCKNERIRTMRMTYESGVTQTAGTATSAGAAVPLGSLSNTSVFGAGTSFAATSATLLAKRAAPPAPMSLLGYYGGILATLFVGFMGGCFVLVALIAQSAFLLVIFAALSAWGCLYAYNQALAQRVPVDHYNTYIYPRQKALWERQWVCGRCGWIGALHEPEHEAPAIPPPMPHVFKIPTPIPISTKQLTMVLCGALAVAAITDLYRSVRSEGVEQKRRASDEVALEKRRAAGIAQEFIYKNSADFTLIDVRHVEAVREQYNGQDAWVCRVVFNPNRNAGSEYKELYVVADKTGTQVIGAMDANRRPLKLR